MISIIISAIRLGNFFDECMESCLRQTYGDTEIILVTDDGSEDFLRCKEKAKTDGRIRIVSCDADSSIGTSRNLGLAEAKGEYVCFVDADDMFYDETSLERMIRSLTVENGDVLLTNYIRKKGDEMIPVVPHGFTEAEDTDSVDFRFRAFNSVGHFSYVWAKLYRRECLEENAIRFPDSNFGEDKIFNFCVYGARCDLVFSDQITYVFRMGDETITTQYKDDFKENWEKNAIFFDRYMESRGRKEKYEDLSAFLMMFTLIFHVRQEYRFGLKAKDFAKVVEQYTTDDYVRSKMEYLVSEKICGMIEDISFRTGTDNLSKWILRKRNEGISWWLERMFDLSIDRKHSDTRGLDMGITAEMKI